MRVIHAIFERTSEAPVGDLFGATGVYVLWTPRARVRPSYIGEGYLLHRLSDHCRTFGDGFDGTLAILGHDDTWRLKEEAQIVEHLLLAVADDVDRAPAVNKSAGIRAGVRKVFRSHGVLRINISGLDPLRDPLDPNVRLRAAKRIVLRSGGGDGEPVVEHEWNLRPISPSTPWRRVIR